MSDPPTETFSQSVLTAIADALGALATDQNTRQHRKHILAFIRHAMKPERHIRAPHRFEPMRSRLNQALLFAGLVVSEAGTLSESRRRADGLRADLTSRGVHPDVLKFCREELVSDDYFHAVQEAVKSDGEKLRARTGLTDDGGELVDRALAGSLPMLAINALKTDSERSEQKGFANLVQGVFGMFRNPTAAKGIEPSKITAEYADEFMRTCSRAFMVLTDDKAVAIAAEFFTLIYKKNNGGSA